MAADDDNVQDKNSKIMESSEDKKPDEIVPLTLESILCGLNFNVNFVLLGLMLPYLSSKCDFLQYFSNMEFLEY